MVGHTGKLDAAEAAVAAADTALGRVVEAVLAQGGALLITADHGNAEQMAAADGSPHTAHTTNPVPLIVVGTQAQKLASDGALADIAPTLLARAHIAVPPSWTGRDLVLQ
jgi:2,3-bisphosphoglycerate-independent phosphoglycerate mutase